MRRTVIIAAVTLAVIVVAVGGTAFYVLTRLDSLAQAAIEEIGSAATGVAVSLKSVEINAADGRGRLVGLRVANPEGFPTDDDALSVAETSLALDLKSLTADTIVVREVAVRAPRFNYVIGPDGGNIDGIIGNLERSGAAEDTPSTGGGAPDADGSGRKIMIQHLLIEGAEVKVTAAQLGAEGLTVSLPTIDLRDLGTEEEGLTTAVLLGKVAERLQESANEEFAKIPSLQAILATPIKEPVKRAMEGTGKAVETLGDRVKRLLGN